MITRYRKTKAETTGALPVACGNRVYVTCFQGTKKQEPIITDSK